MNTKNFRSFLAIRLVFGMFTMLTACGANSETSTTDSSTTQGDADATGDATPQTDSSTAQGDADATGDATPQTDGSATQDDADAADDADLAVNGLPSAPTVRIDPIPARTDDTLRAVLVAPAIDPDGDAIAYTWHWSRDGVVATDYATTSVPASATTRGEVWGVEAIPNDSHGDGSAGTATVTIGNTAPSIEAVTIRPSTIVPGTVLSCEATGQADADGDQVAVSYTWTVNGEIRGTGPNLSTTLLTGDAVTCAATPNDGIDSGTPVIAMGTVGSSGPALSSVSLTPTVAREADILTCTPTASGSTQFTYVYSWSVASANPGVESQTLDGTYFKRGDIVTCSVSLLVGLTLGPALTSNTVTILNTPPTLAGVTVSPANPIAGDTLTCSGNGFSDPDGDVEATTYQWKLDGVPAGSGSTLSTPMRRGQVVSCSATPGDGTDVGDAKVGSVTVRNTAPTVTGARITPSPAYAGNVLLCEALGYQDVDRDLAATTFKWSFNGFDSTSGATYAGNIHRGDVLVCTATPYDGFNEGTAVQTSITVANSPPSAPTVGVSPAAPTDAQAIECSVTAPAIDPDGDPVAYGYSWSRNGAAYPAAGTSSTLSASFTSPGETWKCTVVASDGTASSSASASATICTQRTVYVDADGDGHGRPSGSIVACGVPFGYASTSDDCNDGKASVYPGAFEACDGLDNDCDGLTDEDTADADGDGWRVCDHDCDDTDFMVNPGSAEICHNEVDDDCDGTTDVADVDGDGYFGCGQDDCNDASALAHPGGGEVLGDLLDNDCDGIVDSTTSDDDGDGFSEATGDCDDAAPWVHPGAIEIPDDGEDQDCDGQEAYAVDFITTGMGIFVDATSGDDFFPGTKAFPVRTISRGAALALVGVPVLVAVGTYMEDVAASWGIYGGYLPDWSGHSGEEQTNIVGHVTAGTRASHLHVTGALSASLALDVFVQSNEDVGLTGDMIGRATVMAADGFPGRTYGVNSTGAVYNTDVRSGSPSMPTASGADGYDTIGVAAHTAYGVVVNGGIASPGADGTDGRQSDASGGGANCEFAETQGLDGQDGGNGGSFFGIVADSTIAGVVRGGRPGSGGAGGNGGQNGPSDHYIVCVKKSGEPWDVYCRTVLGLQPEYVPAYIPRAGNGGLVGNSVGVDAAQSAEHIEVTIRAFRQPEVGVPGVRGRAYGELTVGGVPAVCEHWGANGVGSTVPSAIFGVRGKVTYGQIRITSEGPAMVVGVNSVGGQVTVSRSSLFIDSTSLAYGATTDTGGGSVTSSVLRLSAPSGAAVLADYAGSMVSNNTLLASGGAVPLRAENATALVIANNILYTDPGGTCMDSQGSAYQYMVNNLFWGCAGQLVYDSSLAAFRTSITAVNFMMATAGYGNNISSDPLFTDPETGDYSPMDGSPAIDAGYNTTGPALGAITTDLLGVPRPQGAACDIGAHEQ